MVRGWSGRLVKVDGGGKSAAPDETNQLIVDGKVPVLSGGLGTGIDIEAAEEAVDAFVGEAAFAQEANLLDEEGVCRGGSGRNEFGPGDGGDVCGVWLGVRHFVLAFLLRGRFLTGEVASGLQEIYRHQIKTHDAERAKGRA